MISPESQSLISWWGAGLSTILAVVKLAELWRDRFRMEISYRFTGSEKIGNTILIRNISSRPIILSWWEVIYVSGRWPRRKFQDIAYSEHDSGDSQIAPHSTLELNFAEQNYFAWGQRALQGRRVFIRVHIAGRKPILKLVYP